MRAIARRARPRSRIASRLAPCSGSLDDSCYGEELQAAIKKVAKRGEDGNGASADGQGMRNCMTAIDVMRRSQGATNLLRIAQA